MKENNRKNFVPLYIVLELVEIDFSLDDIGENALFVYDENEKISPKIGNKNNLICPLFSQVFRWFRLEHNYNISFFFATDGFFSSTIMRQRNGTYEFVFHGMHKTLEEGERDVLEKMVVLLKQEKSSLV